MSKFSRIFAGLVLSAVPAVVLAQPAAPSLYSADQARQGTTLYAQQCAVCHGAALEGAAGPALKGVPFHQMAAAQNLTAKSLLAVVSQTMPQTAPGSLTPDEYAAIVAYILQQSGYPAGATPLAAGNPALGGLDLSK